VNHWPRVCKQMVQMFGPQWTDKFGAKNETWEEALKPLTYAQVSAGLSKVLRGDLKFYEIDLPRFMELCKPPSRPYNQGETERPSWMKDLSADEVQMHCFANLNLMVWGLRHPEYGHTGEKVLTDKQRDRLWAATRRISHDFFMMREELGKDAVPQEDFLKALHRSWERAIIEE
jgi:hypothetical protein